MKAQHTYTLTEIARRLREPQHRLIHLCEKGVIEPALQDAAGRGSSRVFSERNFLEFALVLQLKRMHQPLSAAAAVVHVLKRFEGEVRKASPKFALPHSLRTPEAPDFRVILSNGSSLYFLIGLAGRKARLLGGVSIESGRATRPRAVERLREADGFGGPEGSNYARLEVSITNIARDLPLD